MPLTATMFILAFIASSIVLVIAKIWGNQHLQVTVIMIVAGAVALPLVFLIPGPHLAGDYLDVYIMTGLGLVVPASLVAALRAWNTHRRKKTQSGN